MPVKEIIQPGTGRPFKLGLRMPTVIHPHLNLSNYLMRSFPLAPALVDYSVLSANWLEQILANDTLGICAEAATFHVGGSILANSQQPIPYTVDDVIDFYSASSGYVRGDPTTDRGSVWQTVLAYWQGNGLIPGQHKIDGYASVDPSDPDMMQAANFLFENLLIGMALPDDWVSPMPSASGFTWDKAGPPNPENGHAFCSVKSTIDDGPIVETWGMSGLMTWEAVAYYCVPSRSGEVYTVLSNESINNAMGVAPSGFDFAQLQRDLQAFTVGRHRR